jgi:hypothetical protein
LTFAVSENAKRVVRAKIYLPSSTYDGTVHNP